MQSFTLVFNPKTKEVGWHGNIAPSMALRLVQQVVIQEEVKRVTENQAEEPAGSSPGDND